MRLRRSILVAAGIAAALVTASACAPSSRLPAPPNPAAPIAPPSASPSAPVTGWWRLAEGVTTLASGLSSPWSVVPLAEGGALISQRDDGPILELAPDGTLRTAGVIADVVSGGESGLHGLAVLETDDTRWLYAYHGAAEDNRVIRMPLDGEPGALSLGTSEALLTGIPRAGTHDGGRIAFGPDGYLYVATGDAQNGDAAQDPDSLAGKILRLTAEGDPAPGNPRGTALWSLGHRNVQGLAWTSDGTMWASEFGQSTWDELNRIEPGANYGWPAVEGVAERAEYVDPVAVWSPGEASPSGIAAVGETVFIAGLRGERLWIVDTSGGQRSVDPVAALVGEHGRLRDAVAGPDGSLWVLTSNTDGRGDPAATDDLLLRLPLAPRP